MRVLEEAGRSVGLQRNVTPNEGEKKGRIGGRILGCTA